MADFDYQQCPIYVNVRDRLTPLIALVDWLQVAGHQKIILLDNASTYEPMVDYLNASPHDVIRITNLGSRSIWIMGPPEDWFVFTDPDLLPIEDCPYDLVERLAEVMDRYPAMKAGAGLYLDDLPAAFDQGILEWERSLVSPARQLEPGVFQSMVDTTFSLNRPHSKFSLQAIRLGYPYQCRHTSWYSEHEVPGEEDAYYLTRATQGPSGSSWAQRLARDGVMPTLTELDSSQ